MHLDTNLLFSIVMVVCAFLLTLIAPDLAQKVLVGIIAVAAACLVIRVLNLFK